MDDYNGDDFYDDEALYGEDGPDDASESIDEDGADDTETDREDGRYEMGPEEFGMAMAFGEEIAEERRQRERLNKTAHFSEGDSEYDAEEPPYRTSGRPMKEREIGVVPFESRIVTVSEAIERGYPICIDYISQGGRYARNMHIRPQAIYKKDQKVWIQSNKGEFILERIYYLAPLFREAAIPVKSPRQSPFFVSMEKTEDNDEILGLYYFLSNYFTEPFDLIATEFEELSETELVNPSMELIHLCEKLISRQMYSRKLSAMPPIDTSHYKNLLLAVIEDIKANNPNMDKTMMIKITLDESTPNAPDVWLSFLFARTAVDMSKVSRTYNEELFDLEDVSSVNKEGAKKEEANPQKAANQMNNKQESAKAGEAEKSQTDLTFQDIIWTIVFIIIVIILFRACG
ncbi:MAG: hypothetical protein ACLFNW_08875 [Desulfobacterales bacterium]